jgi:hypothetical protein
MSDKHRDGIRRGMKWAIEWLHNRANEMNDPHAKQVLNAAAFNMGNDAKRANVKPGEADLIDTLVDALRPFANEAATYDADDAKGERYCDDSTIPVPLGDLRKALAALEKAEGK